MWQENIHVVHPGEVWFTNESYVIQTLLGSCVAITAWHAKTRSGGLCHYLLSETEKHVFGEDKFKYATFAVPYLFDWAQRISSLKEFEFGIFGGSHLFQSNVENGIGENNVQFAERWFRKLKVEPDLKDLRGSYCRKISFSIESGEISLKRYKMDSEIKYR